MAFAGTEFVASGLLFPGDTVTGVTLVGTAAGDASASVAGSPYVGDIVASAAVGTGLGNYTISYVSGTLTVTAAPLTVTATAASKTYGTTVAFAGTEFTTLGLLFGDTVTSVTLVGTAAGDAGASVAGSRYVGDIVASAAVGTGLGNYTISYAPGTLTVTVAPLTITANSTSKTYGALVTFTGVSPEFSITGGTLVGSDSVDSVTLTSAGAAVGASIGTYDITPSVALGTGLANYTITYVVGTLTVDPRALEITAFSTSKVYGALVTFTGLVPEFSITGGPLVGSDSVDSVTLTSAGAPVGASIGTYDITPSVALGTGLANYTITYVVGTLTVDPRALEIRAFSTSKVYGALVTFTGLVPEFSITGGTLVGSDSVDSVTLTSAGAPVGASIGTYDITPSVALGTGLANYTITYVVGTLTVDPRALEIRAFSTSKVYGALVTFTGLVRSSASPAGRRSEATRWTA